MSLDIHHVRERIVFLYDDEFLRILVGKRTEQHSIDHTEYRGVCADAKGKSKDGEGGKAGIFAEHPHGKTQVLQQCFEQRKTAAVAIIFLGLLDAAEFDERVAAGFFWAHA